MVGMTTRPPAPEPQSARDVLICTLVREWSGNDSVPFDVQADRILAALAAVGHLRNQALIDAVVALAQKHLEMLAEYSRFDDGPTKLFEPWTEMDAVMAELDVAAPGWRERVS